MHSRRIISIANLHGGIGKFKKYLQLRTAEGATPVDLARTEGVDPCALRRWFDILGISRKRHQSPVYADAAIPPASDLREAYERAGSKQAASALYRVTDMRFASWLVRNRIPDRPRSYDSISLRVAHGLTFLHKVDKDADAIRCPDFFRTKKEDGTSYAGLLYWYRSHSPDYREAIKLFLRDMRRRRQYIHPNARR